MSTFEEQLIKWAAKKLKIGAHSIERVTAQSPYYDDYGCPTCGDGAMEYNFTVHLQSGVTKYITITSRDEGGLYESTTRNNSIEYYYGYVAFSKLLKEIVEA